MNVYTIKYLILRILKEAIEKEKNIISRANINRKEIIEQDMNPDIMIESGKKFINTAEKTRRINRT